MIAAEIEALVIAMRNIRGHLCDRCWGWGVRTYATTSTWHGGVGGAMLTPDVCDRCWGSGDANHPWPSHRLLR